MAGYELEAHTFASCSGCIVAQQKNKAWLRILVFPLALLSASLLEIQEGLGVHLRGLVTQQARKILASQSSLFLTGKSNVFSHHLIWWFYSSNTSKPTRGSCTALATQAALAGMWGATGPIFLWVLFQEMNQFLSIGLACLIRLYGSKSAKNSEDLKN